jgi:amino acid permease
MGNLLMVLGFIFLAAAILSLIAVPFVVSTDGWLGGIFFLLLAWFCSWCFAKLFVG